MHLAYHFKTKPEARHCLYDPIRKNICDAKTVFLLVSSMGRADLLWPRVDLDLTRKVRSNTGRVNVDQWWARLEAGRGGDSFDPL